MWACVFGEAIVRLRKRVVFALIGIALPVAALSVGFPDSAPRPACVAIGNTTYRIATGAMRADTTIRIDRVAEFPDLRIRIAETADSADFAFVDDVQEATSCPAGTANLKSVRLDPNAVSPDLVIGTTTAENSDYTIFVRSRTLGPDTAAALFAAAHAPTRILAASVIQNR